MPAKYKSFVLLLLFNSCFIYSHAQNVNLAGAWSGDIEMPNTKLKVIFNIAEDKDGQLQAKLDVPQQSAFGLYINELDIDSDSLHLKVPSILGAYSGTFISNDSLAGKWLQGGLSFTLNLKNNGIAPKAKRPQTPQPPFAYISKQVEYINPHSKFKIAGTLTLPQNALNCPAVVLISGSGAQDRDETIHEHKPFWVIADYFANNGIAVLRVDDRGIGESEGNISDANSADFAKDVMCGVDYLKGQKEIDKTKIGVIGHSEGGMIAPMVSIQSEDISFIIMMAGLGIPGDSLLLKQTKLISQASGIPEQRINYQLFQTKGMINILKTETDAEKRSESLRNAVTGGMYKQMDADRKKMVDAQLKRYDNNWFSFFVRYDPYPDLLKVKCPVLALNGEKDLQVPPKANLRGIEKALSEGENTNFKTLEIPNLNHLFQNCETGLPQEYSQIEETISPEVLKIMKDWIIETTNQ